ncbi:flavin-nucleotide-binding protein [Cladophialophora carrionii]|uniref:Flavin-nucleotide-binding protein n=1 Tax=Cladophialophora carrionii TaxID=86049 RepID=A0A1C1CXK6_9EURO|nr:flavin-nucleotide-binding protein [Cladophialophora carrionii]
MVRNLEYPKKPQNTVKRYDSRGTYDLGAIHSIINTTSVLHVSFAPSPDEPFPAILPMIGVMGSFEYPSAGIDEPLDCYLHGYVSSRIMRLARASDKGLPLCVAATKVDGLVLSLTPNSHSYNYRSAVLQGYAKPVESDEEKLYAMRLITNKVVDGRWENTRVPPDNVEMTSTTILRVKVETGSGKIRQGGPHDEAKDEKRDDIIEKVWTGVVPVYEAFDTPIPSTTNKVRQVPSYLDAYVSQTNSGNRQAALDAVNEP